MGKIHYACVYEYYSSLRLMTVNWITAKTIARIAAAVYLDILSPESDTRRLSRPMAVGDMKFAILGEILAIKEKTGTLS